MDVTQLSIVAIAFLTAGVIKGAIGVGLPTTAIAILGLALGLRDAVVILIVPSLIANIWQIARGGELISLFRRFWLMNATACLGIWLGTVIFFQIDPAVFSGLLGIVIGGYAVINLLAYRPTVPNGREFAWSPFVGFAAGLLTGTTGSLLMPVVVYLQALELDKDRFVQAAGLSLLIGTVAWAAALYEQGAIDHAAVLLSSFALIPTVLGMLAGVWLRDWISQDLFRRFVALFFLILGGNLIYANWL